MRGGQTGRGENENNGICASEKEKRGGRGPERGGEGGRERAYGA